MQLSAYLWLRLEQVPWAQREKSAEELGRRIVSAAGARGHMTSNLTCPDRELRTLRQKSRQVLTVLADRLADRPDMQNAIARLIRPYDMWRRSTKRQNLMRLVLQASVAALVNVQSVDVVDAEIRLRAVMWN